MDNRPCRRRRRRPALADPLSMSPRDAAREGRPSVLHEAARLRLCQHGLCPVDTVAVRPKIQASWNIHSSLLHDDITITELDFFVMLASFASSFSNPSQTNYSASCTFQDALAHHRRSKGLPAVSLDLGIIHHVGVLAETGMTDNLRNWADSFSIREKQLQSLVRIAILDQVAKTGVLDAQIPTGFASLWAANAAGIPRPSYLNDPRFAMLASDGRLADQQSPGGGS
ncbi:Lovastatin diketide synthase LovF [Colletotrichum tanaceti]|uniref:Lovastatin diketide synthase LovF n=1 Tax=Colletotrichum tanaceti TaxID=1306861 RepID=A0A4U6XVK0_9PEZI|nr:Lovastatin diketide synthase LovF [Colletotrichum tanaceti]TKW60065.1 Lovastatin diketide synthase LovF [Colletotrichum tanaceti]